ncbi:hypothetical protein M5689_006630 [Euphorbia peplus]|nr:hypothetical protein M5689_006630 [Euphorbia peplus]
MEDSMNDPLEIIFPNFNPSNPQLNVDLNLPPNHPPTLPTQTYPNKKKNLSPHLKKNVIETLLKEQIDGKLSEEEKVRISNLFSISRRSLGRLWREAKQILLTGELPNFSSEMVKAGRKRVEINYELVKQIPLRHRTNIRSLSKAMSLPKSTVHRRIKEGKIRPHTNAVKPSLTPDNLKARLEFCLSMVDRDSFNTSLSFTNMHERIHIDEKWFCISNASQRYYLHPDETEPYRNCKSKRFMTKIMFLVAVARPRKDLISGMSFDGKIGIWPLVYKEAAKRNSRNRSAGTMVTKPILSVTKEVIRSFMIEKVIPSVKEKWPFFSSKTIFIQQDNAKPHLDINDNDFVEAARGDGFDINLCCQPPNSPDMNVLDLGFFRAIDTLQQQEAPTSVEEFILAVENAFTTYPEEELNNVFLTLQSCMVEVMKIGGGNNYKFPHMKKHALIRRGELPEIIGFDQEILMQTRNALGYYTTHSSTQDENSTGIPFES